MDRPTLLPGLAVLWRGQQTLQLGLDPRYALMVDLPDPAAAGLLDLLDGERTEAGLMAAAVRRGIDEIAARSLLRALCAYGLVVPAHTLLPRGLDEQARARLLGEAAALALRGRATRVAADSPPPGAAATHATPSPAKRAGAVTGVPVSSPVTAQPAEILRRRMQARVRITGRGRLGIPIAVTLAVSGIGHIDPALEGDVLPDELVVADATNGSRPLTRAAAACAAIARLAPSTRSAALPRRHDATFTVQVGPLPVPAALYALSHRRMPHLAVEIRDGAVVVGPLVPAGGTPCLNCLDLHRRDRDPGWPTLATQLPGVPEHCAATTLLVAAGYAAAEVLRHVDGGTPQTIGATVEITSPGETRRRTWIAHPNCDCVRRLRRRREAARHDVPPSPPRQTAQSSGTSPATGR